MILTLVWLHAQLQRAPGLYAYLNSTLMSSFLLAGLPALRIKRVRPENRLNWGAAGRRNRCRLSRTCDATHLIKWVSWEFVFRGFLPFGFRQALRRERHPHLNAGVLSFGLRKARAEVIASTIAGFVLCRIALDGRSIIPGVMLHALVAGTMDFLNCRWWI